MNYMPVIVRYSTFLLIAIKHRLAE